ncbi:hypothetical protein BDZ97DRAFT_1917184 [Flammula alnicola]|nr:hypothetical protein BDZ97DRAFT_1917184 [Flammula alnicola]
MADNLQTTAPIIPVIDERLACLPTAPNDHKAKVAKYNELLEVIYQQEIELGTIKSTLLDMREEIAQEARILDGTSGQVIPAEVSAGKSENDSDIDAEHVLSDSSSDKGPGKRDGAVRKVAKKNKKAKGSRRSKVPDAQLDGDWDFKLEFGPGAMHRGRRESDASDSSDEPLL